METPSYIKALLAPNGGKQRGRRIWSIELESVLLPFFTASNVNGDTAIPAEALGAPLRLAFAKDGSPKFTANGKPQLKVAKELSDEVRLMRENLVAGLMAYTRTVANENPKGYRAQIDTNRKAGEPIIQKDEKALSDYLALLEAVVTLAKAPVQEAEKVAA